MMTQDSLPATHAVRWREVALVAGIMVAALCLRLYNVASQPANFLGDEAVIGLEGQHILREGWIGPYSPYTWGQPTGPMYLTAVSIWLFGDTILAVRLVPVVTGTLTVLALYVILRRSFGIPCALVGSGLLAVMTWHVYYARIGFPLETWPLCVVLATGALAEAIRRADWRWWAAAGGLAGLGIYAYNAHPLFLGILTLFLGLRCAWNREGAVRTHAVRLAGFVLLFGLTALPMALYATGAPDAYLLHFQEASLFRREEWTAVSSLEGKIGVIAGRYLHVWDRVCCRPELDWVDSSGATPLVPAPLLALAGAGAALGLARHRHQPLVAVGLLVVALTPLGAAVTVGALPRRTLIVAPFLAMFAGLAAVEAVRRARIAGANVFYASIVGMVGLLGLTVIQSWRDYFVVYGESVSEGQMLGEGLTDASLFLDRLAPQAYVYFYNEQTSINYETRQFLAPRVRGEDRSAEFGQFRLDVDPSKGEPVFVLLGDYQRLTADLRRLYPGGTTCVGSRRGRPTFVAHLLAAEPNTAGFRTTIRCAGAAGESGASMGRGATLGGSPTAFRLAG
jgi:4-amino-4-deoxy-L-arabinose transferase-like glycosyltransferase